MGRGRGAGGLGDSGLGAGEALARGAVVAAKTDRPAVAELHIDLAARVTAEAGNDSDLAGRHHLILNGKLLFWSAACWICNAARVVRRTYGESSCPGRGVPSSSAMKS